MTVYVTVTTLPVPTFASPVVISALLALIVTLPASTAAIPVTSGVVIYLRSTVVLPV